MLTQYVHSRLGWPSFEKFQPYYIEGLKSLEAGAECLVQIDGGLSPATVAARMRDSLHGFRINAAEWSKVADPVFVELFHKWDGLFTISGPNLNGEVTIRPKQARGRKTVGGVQLSQVVQGNIDRYVRTVQRPTRSAAAASTDDSITAPNSDEATIREYVRMKGLGLLPMTVKFIGQFPEDLTMSLMSTFDVAISYDQQRNITILL